MLCRTRRNRVFDRFLTQLKNFRKGVAMGSEVLTLSQYAKHLGVSRQRVSQYKASGRLDGCYVMRGGAGQDGEATADLSENLLGNRG